jgi:hypothetical protein
MQKITHIASLDDLGRKLTEAQQHIKLLENNFKVLKEKSPFAGKTTVVDQAGFFLANLTSARSLFSNIGIMTVSLLNPDIFNQQPKDISIKAADQLYELRIRTENFIEVNLALLKSIATIEAQDLRYSPVEAFILSNINSNINYQSLNYSWNYAYHGTQNVTDEGIITTKNLNNTPSATFNLFFCVHLQKVEMWSTFQNSGVVTYENQELTTKSKVTLTDVLNQGSMPVAQSRDIHPNDRFPYVSSNVTLWFEVFKAKKVNRYDYVSLQDGKNTYSIKFGLIESCPELVAAAIYHTLSSGNNGSNLENTGLKVKNKNHNSQNTYSYYNASETTR